MTDTNKNTETPEFSTKQPLFIDSVTKCYIFDKYTKSYFYGLDGWNNTNWGNDKNLAILMTPDMGVKMLVELRDRNSDLDLWVNVL